MEPSDSFNPETEVKAIHKSIERWHSAFDYLAGGRVPTTLAGGFACSLTPAERNEWELYVRTRPEWVEFSATTANVLHRLEYDNESTIESGLRMNEVQMAVAREQASAHTAALIAMHGVAAEWFAGLCERRKAAESDE